MREPENITAVATLRPDMLGFIFYKASLRYAGELSPGVLKSLPENIRKVGVFVNAETDYVENIVEKYTIDIIQLHGNESPEMCRQLKEKGYRVMKAFGIESSGDFGLVRAYEHFCHMFLFDTRSSRYGGTGKAFDWNLLEQYNGTVPFLLSGGIAGNDMEKIRELNHPELVGIDLNSRFEKAPGLKDAGLLARFLSGLY